MSICMLIVYERMEGNTGMWVLSGIIIVILGFALRFNPLVIATSACLVTGISTGMSLIDVISLLGESFTRQRFMVLVFLVLPIVGILEAYGLRERAQLWVQRLRGVSTSRVLLAYLAIRQITSSLGLMALGGHPQMVRPLVAPMAESAAHRRYGIVPRLWRERIRAHAAATDNIGLFFGEDTFVAVGPLLLMQGFLSVQGYSFDPLQLAVWAIPSAFIVFLLQGLRLHLLERQLARVSHHAPSREDTI